MPKDVSIVIATRNRAAHLALSLHSIRKSLSTRTYPVELLVIDDASTDGTPDLLRNSEDWIRWRRIERGGGYRWNPGPVFNLGHRLASGKVHLEQGGEVVHLTDCVGPLTRACKRGTIALATVYNGTIEQMEAMRRGIALGARLPCDASAQAGEPLEINGGRVQIPKVRFGGVEVELYCGADRPVPFLFLGAVTRYDWERLGGYDEQLPGAVDQDLARRFRELGGRFVWVGKAVAFHLAHGRS